MSAWFIGLGTFAIILSIAILVGWIVNIVKLANSKEIDVLAILRIIGIFVPILGGVLGFVK